MHPNYYPIFLVTRYLYFRGIPIFWTPKVTGHPAISVNCYMGYCRERSGSVVECLTLDQRAAGSNLTGVSVLCP